MNISYFSCLSKKILIVLLLSSSILGLKLSRNVNGLKRFISSNSLAIFSNLDKSADIIPVDAELTSVDVSFLKIVSWKELEDFSFQETICKNDTSTEVNSASTGMLSGDLSSLEKITKLLGDENSDSDLSTENFASIFHQCAPYIAMHRGSKVVVHLPGHCLANKDYLDAVLDDISILHLLGVQICLVVGVREQLNKKLTDSENKPIYYDGIRVTDELALKLLMEVSGLARFEIESSLARGFKGMSGQSGINVVSGNFFYTAKPLGVREGVDFRYYHNS